MAMRPRRSVLYVPGDNEHALEKAKNAPCRFDHHRSRGFGLAGEQGNGAKQAIAVIREGGFGTREVVLRVNPIETPWGMADLHAAIAAAPDAILIPKVSHSGDVIGTAKVVKAAEAAPHSGFGR